MIEKGIVFGYIYPVPPLTHPLHAKDGGGLFLYHKITLS